MIKKNSYYSAAKMKENGIDKDDIDYIQARLDLLIMRLHFLCKKRFKHEVTFNNMIEML